MSIISERIGRFAIRHRGFISITILLLTVFFFFQARKVRIESLSIDLFPEGHPYVETFKEYQDIFGGANAVLIAVVVNEGDIFNYETLSKIKRITKAVELLPAINNYQVFSIAQRKVKKVEVDEIAGFRSEPVMWPDIPKTEEEIEKLKKTIRTTGRIQGTLVSLDSKAALIVAGFFERNLAPKVIFERIEEITTKEEDANTSIHLIGRPILLGWIFHQYPQLLWLFSLTILTIVAVLFFYFRDIRGVLIPLTTAVISAIWGIGFLGLFGYNFDPLIIVVPFVISARALSHSVQLIERFLEEHDRIKDRKKASVATFSGLFKPAMLSILTDAAGVFLVIMTPMPLMRKLALMGGFWVLSIIVTDLLFNPILLSYLPSPKLRVERKSPLDRLLSTVGGWCFGKGQWVIMGVTLVVFIVGFVYARGLVVGDVHPGTPLLWPDSRYNRDTAKIGEKFGNTEILNIIVEGEEQDTIKSPEVLRKMESFQRELEELSEVWVTTSIADMVPEIIRVMHGGDPKWELIPTDRRESGFFLGMIFNAAEPGDLARFITPDSRNANISVYLKDHKGDTLRRVVKKAKEFIAANPVDGIKFRLAGGFGGLLAAVNEVIASSQAKVTTLAFAIVFLFCGITFRSITAGILFMIPIALSNYLTYALMGAKGIGLDVNVLPVVSLGVGLGVDYGLYIVSRIEEEYKENKDLKSAILTSISTAGRAVTFTATTMVVGIIFWAWSFLRFQADMGLLLAFWMIVSMLGGLLLLPTIIYLVKPKFICR